MKIEEFRGLKPAELDRKAEELRRERFQLRIQQQVGQVRAEKARAAGHHGRGRARGGRCFFTSGSGRHKRVVGGAGTGATGNVSISGRRFQSAPREWSAK